MLFTKYEMALISAKKQFGVLTGKNSSMSQFLLRVVRIIFGAPLGIFLQLVPQIFILDCVISAIGSSNPYAHYFSIKDDPQWDNISNVTLQNYKSTLESLHLKYLPQFITGSVLFVSVLYWAIGAILYYLYDVKQKDDPSWRIQPNKSVTPTRDWILDVWHNTIGGAILIGIALCYTYNGGPRSKVYYGLSDYPLWWTVLQAPLVFLYQDYSSYWQHRLQHTPFMYKHFHIHHHKYKPQRALVSLAGHPIDIIPLLQNNFMPVFVVPLHFVTVAVLLINFFHNFTVDHSGINLSSPWWLPWKHDVIYHDIHHRYANCNYGLFTPMWDIVFETNKPGSIRQNNSYSSEIPGVTKNLSGNSPEFHHS